MNVVDSSGWIEYFVDGPNARFFAEPIRQQDTLIVPSLNLYEVYRWLIQRLDPKAALDAIAPMMAASIVELDANLALAAAELSHREKLPLVDSIILATARRFEATLWTQDADFEGLAGINYRKKK